MPRPSFVLGVDWFCMEQSNMPESHSRISDYAEELTYIPRAHLGLEIRQDHDGLKLLHEGRLVVECHMTKKGMAAAAYMVEAIGGEIPPLGESIAVRVSTGVLFRAVAIASLDFSKEESFGLLDRWLEEAQMQRGGGSDAT